MLLNRLCEIPLRSGILNFVLQIAYNTNLRIMYEIRKNRLVIPRGRESILLVCDLLIYRISYHISAYKKQLIKTIISAKARSIVNCWNNVQTEKNENRLPNKKRYA